MPELELGWGNFEFWKFTDENFTRAASPSAILLYKSRMRADDNIGDTQNTEVKVVNLAGGGKHIITQPNDAPAQMTLTVLNPIPEDLNPLLFVDSQQTISGPKKKTE